MRPFRSMRLVRRNLAAHRRCNRLSRSRGISMTSAPVCGRPRSAKPQRVGCSKGPTQICRPGLRRVKRRTDFRSRFSRQIPFTHCSRAPRRDCSAGAAGQNSLIEGSRCPVLGEPFQHSADMRSKISVGHYCPQGQLGQNNGRRLMASY